MKKLLFGVTALLLLGACSGSNSSKNENQDSISVSTVDNQTDPTASNDGTPVAKPEASPSDTGVASDTKMAEKKEANQQTGSEYGDLVDQFVKNVKSSTSNYKRENWSKAEKLERKAWKQAAKIEKVKGKLTADELKKFNKAYKELGRNADLWQ